jgi:peptidyl-prolyl cis-trans isomerase D
LTKQVQVAYLVRNVVPSTRTYQDTYSIASKFAGENASKADFDAAVAEQKLSKRVISVGENDRQIVGLENARTLIRAAYETKVGEIISSQEGTPIFELGDNFVIAVLAEATEEGVATFEEVQARVELSVIKEKKAQLLVEKANAALQGKTSIEDVAAELNLTVQNAASITFNSFQIPGVGLEPAVIGTATSLEANQISKPIAGNNGVFVLKVTSVNQIENQDLATEKLRLAQNLSYRAAQQTFDAHKNAVEITDKRAKFY